MRNNFFINLIERHNKNTAPIWVSGFTLIELMVATTIFTIVMLMGVGSLVTSSNAAKSAQKLQIAVDNVNFAMESMTREIRMGTNYDCVNPYAMSKDDKSVHDCVNGGIIAFTPQQIGSNPPSRVGYFRQVTTINGVAGYTLTRCEYVNNNNNCASIVSPSVNVEGMGFYVVGSDLPTNTTDKRQPSVRILMKGTISINGVGTPFALQTMASQRSAEK